MSVDRLGTRIQGVIESVKNKTGNVSDVACWNMVAPYLENLNDPDYEIDQAAGFDFVYLDYALQLIREFGSAEFVLHHATQVVNQNHNKGNI